LSGFGKRLLGGWQRRLARLPEAARSSPKQPEAADPHSPKILVAKVAVRGCGAAERRRVTTS